MEQAELLSRNKKIKKQFIGPKNSPYLHFDQTRPDLKISKATAIVEMVKCTTELGYFFSWGPSSSLLAPPSALEVEVEKEKSQRDEALMRVRQLKRRINVYKETLGPQ